MTCQLLQVSGQHITDPSPCNLVWQHSKATCYKAVPELSEFLYQTGLETQHQLLHFLGLCSSGHGLSDFSPLLPHFPGEKVKSDGKAGLTVEQ